MKEIKAYRPTTHSLSSSQVLAEPYTYQKARVVVREMADAVALGLVDKQLVAGQFTLTVNYDRESQPTKTMVKDWYGRLVPKPVHGTATLPHPTNSARQITQAVLQVYDTIVDSSLLVRRITIGTNNVTPTAQQPAEVPQLDLFVDYEALEQQRQQEKALLERERRMQEAALKIKKKFGRNAILRGTDFEEGATARERNRQIGGHKE